MTAYAPKHQPWHDLLPGACSCDPTWSERDMVDAKCWYHQMIEVVGELREQGWIVTPNPMGPWRTLIETAIEDGLQRDTVFIEYHRESTDMVGDIVTKVLAALGGTDE